MRINIYAEELTEEVKVIRKPSTESPLNREFLGIRLYLKSHADLHNTPNDDDRSAVTLWVPFTQQHGNDTQYLSRILECMADAIGKAKESIEP